MYQVKHAEKGRVQEFDIGVYNREAYAERTRREFRQLLSNAQVFTTASSPSSRHAAAR